MRDPVRVVLAPNAFKGSFGAVDVARAWRSAIGEARPELVVDSRPLTDGGDGFLAVLGHYEPLLEVQARVRDPLGRPVASRWAWDPAADVGYVESAEAVGLARLADGEADPLATTSFGLGQILRSVARLGARRIVVGLGGSATVDGGMGTGRALGYRYAAADGRPIERAGDLPALARIVPPDLDPLDGVEVVALADVDNPLLGSRGAAAVFGPQKGAGPAEVARLEEGLARSAERWVADLGAAAEVAERPGAGAAGGLGGGLVALAAARLEAGSGWFAARCGLETALEGAALLVTGEGRYDAQSAAGKATGWALEAASRAGVPAAIVAGTVAAEAGSPGRVVALDAGDLDRPGTRLSLEDLGELALRAVDATFPRGA